MIYVIEQKNVDKKDKLYWHARIITKVLYGKVLSNFMNVQSSQAALVYRANPSYGFEVLTQERK